MSTVAPTTIAPNASRIGTRSAPYQMTDYLERIGVEVVFGLCGHTIIALLDALGRSRIRFVSTRHEQIAAHAADGYARPSGQARVVLTHPAPGATTTAGAARAGARRRADGHLLSGPRRGTLSESARRNREADTRPGDGRSHRHRA